MFCSRFDFFTHCLLASGRWCPCRSNHDEVDGTSKVDVVSCSRCWPELLAARWYPLRYNDARTLSSCASSLNDVILPDHEQFLPCFITTWRRYPERHWKDGWSHNVQSNGPLLSSYCRYFCASDLALWTLFLLLESVAIGSIVRPTLNRTGLTIFRLRLLTLAEIPIENDSVAVSLQLTPVDRLPRCLGRAAREAVCVWFAMSAGELLKVHELLITLWGMITDDTCSRESAGRSMILDLIVQTVFTGGCCLSRFSQATLGVVVISVWFFHCSGGSPSYLSRPTCTMISTVRGDNFKL